MTLHSATLAVQRSPLMWQRELLHVAAACMEATWCIPLFIALAPGAAILPTPNIAVFVLANVLASMGLVRFLMLRHVPYHTLRWIVLAGVVGACAVALYSFLPIGSRDSVPLIIRSFSKTAPFLLPPPIMAVAVILFLWFRGIRVATTLITPISAGVRFRMGILIMIVLGIIPDTRLQSDLVLLLPLFFFAGLLATTLARAASLRFSRDIKHTPFGGRWLGLTGMISVVVTTVGFLLALLLAGYGVEGASQIIRGVMSAVFIVFLVVVTPLLYVLDWLLRPIAAMIARLPFNPFSLQPNNPMNQPPDDPNAAQRLSQFATLLEILKYAALGLIVLVVIAALFMLLRNRSVGTEITGEEREDLEGDSLLDSLRAALKRGIGNLQNSLGGLRTGASELVRDRLSIRRLYARLIERATTLGYPREPARTPFEYREKLKAAFPGFPSEVEMITRVYVDTHYGELPESQEALSEAQSAVERMLASVEKAAPGGSKAD